MTIQEILSSFDITVSNLQKEKLDTFYSLLVEWNEKMNLTAITDYDEVLIKHFADSIIGLPYMNGKTCDVGAGAGFPSIPLSVMGVDGMVLADSLAKRINFLNEVIDKLDLNCTAVHIRAEDMGRGAYRESFDTVTARAVANTQTLVEYLLPLVKVGGKAVLYKSGDVDEELKNSEFAITKLGGKIEKVVRYELCGMERSLVIIDKISATPKAYPRSGNKPRTQPLTKK